MLHDGIQWALSLSGGGAHGAYGFGLVSRLLQNPSLLEGLTLCYGTSIGGLLGTACAQSAIANSLWPLDRFQRLLMSFCGEPLTQERIWDAILEALPDNEANFLIAQAWDEEFPVEVGVTALSMRTFEAKLFTTSDPGMTPDRLRRALLASAALPSVTSPVDVCMDGICHMDGGFAENNPESYIPHSRLADTLDLVVRIDYGEGPSIETGIVSSMIEAPNLLTRLIGTATEELSHRLLGVRVPGTIGMLVSGWLAGRSRSELVSRYGKDLLGRTTRDLTDLPVLRLRPSRRLPTGLTEFHHAHVSEAIQRGRADADALLEQIRKEGS